VSEGFKGGPKSGATIRIRELGGTKDGVSLTVSGTADFDRGEDVVVMLSEANSSVDSAYPVIGMMMGKYNLEKGADGKEYLIGAGIGAAKHPGLRHEASTERSARISLESLREIIRNQAAEPHPSPTPAASEVASKNEIINQSGRSDGKNELHEEGIGEKPNEGEAGRGKILFLLGLGIGTLWFLISRKKRR
jgi:hypothetical protein